MDRRSTRDQIDSPTLFPKKERRCAWNDNHFGARSNSLCQRINLISPTFADIRTFPKVLANQNADFLSCNIDHYGLRSFRKISRFIKDVIVWQKSFRINALDLPATQHSAGIGYRQRMIIDVPRQSDNDREIPRSILR